MPIDLTQSWTLRIWCVGVLLFALRLVLSGRHISRLRTTGEPAELAIVARAAALADRMGLTRPVAVLMSKIADCPSVAGWLRPAILLPAAVLASMDVEQLDAILAHEPAHIRRHDYLVNLLQTVVETLLFYHPAVWWLSARIRREREFCCDDLAVRCTGGAIGYARALTNLERLRSAPALSPAANGGPLLARIRRLTGEGAETAPSKFTVLAAIAAAAVCFVVSTHWANGQSRNTADVVSRAPLAYPKAARVKGIEGTVLAEVTLDAQGGVTDAHVLSGPIELRRAALESVLGWQFGHPSAGEVRQVPIDFSKDMPTQEGDFYLFTGRSPNGSVPGDMAPDDSRLEVRPMELDQLRAQIEMLKAQLPEQQNQLARTSRQNRSGDLPGWDSAREAELARQLEQEINAQSRQQEDLNRGDVAHDNSSRLQARRLQLDELRAQIQMLERQLAAQVNQREGSSQQNWFGDSQAIDQASQAELQRQMEGEINAVSRRHNDLIRSQDDVNRELDNLTPERIQALMEVERLKEVVANLLPHPLFEPIEDLMGRQIGNVSVRGASLTSSALNSLPLHRGDAWTAESQSKLEAWARGQGSTNPGLRFFINDDGELFITINLH